MGPRGTVGGRAVMLEGLVGHCERLGLSGSLRALREAEQHHGRLGVSVEIKGSQGQEAL